MEQLDFIINGGETRRFHTWPVLREQRVDSHSWTVAMLCALMASDADPSKGFGLSVPLLMAALTHDMAEHKTGDMAAPVKRAMPPVLIGGVEIVSFREYYGDMEAQLLTDQGLEWESLLAATELRWLKLADTMEGCLYCIRERMLGNKLMGVPFINHRQYIRDVLGSEEPAAMEAQIINYIDDMWEQANG